MNKLYITTPLYYVNDKPHAGTAYSTVIADIFNRFHQFFSKETLFLTGVDEHGQKCQQAAESKNMDVQAHCDEMAQIFIKTWANLNIKYDVFYRTTSSEHQQCVQKALQKIFDRGFIYESTYEGWYSVSEEIFYKEKDLIDGKSPEGKPVIKIKEKNYFFKMSQFKNQLIQHLEDHPDFIYPSTRQNEVLSFVKNLEDLCISRPKSRLKWGVPLPFDSDYVIYVWVDALLNYIFGAGLWGKSDSDFEKWWKESVHFIGKDILITHAVYWPCVLMALDLPLPKKIVSHGWLLNQDLEKMSKSQGDILDPLELAQQIGHDSLRYFFSSVRFGHDAPISQKMILQEHNQNLANNLGNLVQRVLTLIESSLEGTLPPPPSSLHPLQEKSMETCEKVFKYVHDFSIHMAVFEITELLNQTNKFLEETAPWNFISEKDKTAPILYTALDVLRVAVSLLQPIIPNASQEALRRLRLPPQSFEQTKKVNQLKSGMTVKKEAPIFPRVRL